MTMLAPIPGGRFTAGRTVKRMVPAVRWLVVAAVAIIVTAAPAAARLWPVSEQNPGLTSLARKVAAAESVPWSGEVRSVGSLSLPLKTSDFGGIARLVGEGTDLRVWWRAKDAWRVDRIRATGETDSMRDGGLAIRFSYESQTARFNDWSSVRLPDDVDLLPSTLASRIFEDATRGELSRLPAQRVAGHVGAGIRLTPADTRSSVGHADVWADPDTGLPLLVELYADGSRRPLLTSAVTSLDLARPSAEATRFELGSEVTYIQGTSFDDAASANAYAPFRLPGEVAGLDRRGGDLAQGAVGFYGHGPTALIALPLRDSIARSLDRQLDESPAATRLGRSVSLEVGPLSVLLVRSERGNFLLAGTVTPDTLSQASTDLVAGVVRTR